MSTPQAGGPNTGIAWGGLFISLWAFGNAFVKIDRRCSTRVHCYTITHLKTALQGARGTHHHVMKTLKLFTLLALAIIGWAYSSAATTIYIDKESTGNIYAWNADNSNNATWPGQAISSLTTTATIDGIEYYAYTYEGEAAGLIFNKEGSQTGNIVPVNNKIYKYTGGEWCTSLCQFVVTYSSQVANPSDQFGRVYVWDRNENASDGDTDRDHVSELLGAFPGPRTQSLPELKAKDGAKFNIATVDIRVSDSKNTYKPFVIFSNDKNQQTADLELQLEKAYYYKDNVATVLDGIPILRSYFPDLCIREHLKRYIDINKDAVISDDELNISEINFNNNNSVYYSTEISTFEGFELFKNLERITFTGNSSRLKGNFETLDLTMCENLKYINFSGASNMNDLKLLPTQPIETIILSNCSKLPPLDFSTYQSLKKLVLENCSAFNTVDVTQNPGLKWLQISSLPITELDVTNNGELEYLAVASTQITTLNTSPLANLRQLRVRSNSKIKDNTIDVTKNKNLTWLHIYNQSTYTELDLTQNLTLDTIEIQSCNKLVQPKVSPDLTTLQKFLIAACPKIKDCTFDFSKNTDMREITIGTASGTPTSGTEPTLNPAYSGFNNIIKGVGSQMKKIRYICTEGQRYDGDTLNLSGCDQLHNLDVMNCKLNKLVVKGCTKLGNIDNGTETDVRNTNSQFFIPGNYLRSLDLTGVTLPYNYNISTKSKVPFKDTEFVRHYSYNAQISPELTPNVALVYHDRWAETPNYTYLVYVRLDKNENDKNSEGKVVPTLNELFNQEACEKRNSDPKIDVAFDYKRVKLWSRFTTSQDGPVLDVHGTKEIHAISGVEAPTWTNEEYPDLTQVDPTHVLGNILSLGMYTVPCGHDRRYHETTGAEGTTADVEDAHVGGTVSYFYSTREWSKATETPQDEPAPMPRRANGTGADLDTYESYNGEPVADATAERDYYKGLTLLQDNTVVEQYNNTIPFNFDWEVMLNNKPEQIVTAIDSVRGDQVALIQEIQYYNTLGMMSHKPFEGVNIVVTRYSNGTTTTTKIVK